MELNDQLLEVVKKNLPEATAGELKKFIEQAAKDKAQLEETLRVLKSNEAKLEEREKLLKERDAIVERNLVLTRKERDLDKKEIDLQLKEKDMQIHSLNEIKNNMFVIMQLFVKNPRSIEIMNHSLIENQAGYYNGSTFVQPQPISRHEAKTTEQKVEKDDANGTANQ